MDAQGPWGITFRFSSRDRRAVAGRAFVVLVACTAAIGALAGPVAAASDLPPGWTRGTPWVGSGGITESVAGIMARQRDGREVAVGSKEELGLVQPDRTRLRQNPASQAVSQWPPPQGGEGPGVNAPQTPDPSVNFLGASLADGSLFPPDSMGAVGPTQYVVFVNNRVRTFTKAGVADGVLNVTPNLLFESVRLEGVSGTGILWSTSDPQVRYDRSSGRWILTIITVRPTNNSVLIAVSSGSTITSSSNFTFFSFQHDVVLTPGDTGCFADYPSLGVDVAALYIGVNMFCPQTFTDTTGFVVRKSSVLGAGPIVVTAFRHLLDAPVVGVACVSCTGPFSPRGVDNHDPLATEGYFIGVDTFAFSTLMMRRVSTPGGTPAISPNVSITVPTTTFPIRQDHGGNTGGTNGMLDALDDRLFAAHIRNHRLVTAHNLEVNASGVASSGGGRNGSRWYELDVPVGIGTPSLVQAGTLFDPAGSPKGYWIPSVMVSGQGHMAIGTSVAAAADPDGRAGAATAGRLATDALGSIQSPVTYIGGAGVYNPPGNPGSAARPRRWGDYSFTTLDPNDDMTMWTAQEYTSAANTWGVRVVRLNAPPPATPAMASPSSITQGLSSVDVTITGSVVAGSGFFDPGSGFPNRIAALVTGGVTVNSVTYDTPTSVTLNLSTAGASTGAKDVTVTNPDGQSRTGSGMLTVSAASGPAVGLAPSSLSFGTQAVATQSAAQTVTVSNSGTATASLGTAAIVGSNPGDFTKSSDTCAGTLAASSSCDIGVRFAPTTAGSRSATLSLSSDAPGSPHTVALSGTGIVPGPVIDVSPPSLTFAPRDVGTTSALSTITVTNSGLADAALGSVTIAGGNASDFEKPPASDACSGATLAPGSNCTVATRFSPTAAGPRASSLSFTSNAPGSPHVVPLSGTGVAVATGTGWPFFKQNVARTGSTSGSSTLATPLTLQELTLGGRISSSPLIADLDGDGLLDVVALSDMAVVGERVVVNAFRQTPGGLVGMWSTTIPSAIGTGEPTNGFGSLAVDDIDGNGSKEIVAYTNYFFNGGVVTSNEGALRVLAGATGLQIGSPITGVTDLPIGLASHPAIGDVTGEGVKDIVIVRQTGGAGAAAGYYLMGANFTGTTLTKKFDTLVNANQIIASPALADLRPSRPGLEVVIARGGSDTAGQVWLCTPSLTAANCSETVTTTTSHRGLSIADLDGGSAEIVANGRTGTSLHVITTNAALSASGVFTRSDGFLWNTAALGDVSGDGNADVVNVQYSEDTTDTAKRGDVLVRGFTGTTITEIGSLVRTPPVGQSFQALGGPVLADLVAGGRPEAAFGSANGSVVLVGFGPTGVPTELWSHPIGGTTIAPLAVGDVTGDGMIDIVAGTSDGRLVVIGTLAEVNVVPSSIAFGNRRVGQASPSSTVTVSNGGNATIAVGSLGISGANAGDFSLVDDDCSGSDIPGGGSCTAGVVFTPATTGARDATLSVPHDAEGSPATVALSGIGVETGILVDPVAISFGAQELNTTSGARTVTVSNTGTDPLLVGSLTVTGPNAGEFAVTSDACSGASVPPAGSCSAQVRFTPGSLGTRTGSLEIPSDAPTSPDVVALSGTGADTRAPTSEIGFPVAGAYNQAGWNAGCLGPAGDFCGSASDGNGSGVVAVEGSVRIGSTGRYWDGASFSATPETFFTVAGTASWSASWPFSRFPSDDTYTFHVRSRDAAGNVEASPTVMITVDSAAPGQPHIETPAPGAVAPSPVEIEGTAPASNFVEVFEGSTRIASVTASPAGRFALALPMSDGAHTITAVATDAAGNVSIASPARSFFVDRAPPEVQIDAGDGVIFGQGETVRIAGRARDNRGVVSIEVRYFNDLTGAQVAVRTATCGACGPAGTSVAWSDEPTLSAGRYRVEAYAIDVAGLRSERAVARFTRL